MSHSPGFVHSGADRKKETSGHRSQMEEIQEREEPPRPKNPSPSPSSPHPPQTPQQQRPAQSADSSKGHTPPKRFHFVICLLHLTSLPADAALTSLCQCLLTPPLWTLSPRLLRPLLSHVTSSGTGSPDWLNTPDPANWVWVEKKNKQDCGSSRAGLSDLLENMESPGDSGVSRRCWSLLRTPGDADPCSLFAGRRLRLGCVFYQNY